MAITFLFYTVSEAAETGCNNVLGATLILVDNKISLSTRVIKRVSSASVKTMKIFTSVAFTWYVEDSKMDFKNENTAHGNTEQK